MVKDDDPSTELKGGAWQAPVLMPNLGRLTKFLLSNNKLYRRKGLWTFHRRFWHASVQNMQRYLERAGLDIPESELQEIVKNCPACKAWVLPKSTPKAKMSGPTRVNQQIEFDFLFYKGTPIGHHIDRYIRYSLLTVVANRDIESLVLCCLDWFRIFNHYEEFHVDGEGSGGSDEFGIWLQRRGIERKIHGVDEHLKLVESHNKLIRRTMRIMDTEAAQQGMKLTVVELAYEACAAKNSLTEYGGFSPQQCMNGQSLGDWSKSEAVENPDLGIFGDGFLKRTIGMRAMQQAIFEERTVRAMRGKGPEVDKEQLKPGIQIDVWAAPKHKDDSGWRGPCTVINVSEGTVDYRWQSVTRKTDVTKCRLIKDLFVALGVWFVGHAGIAEDTELYDVDLLVLLMDVAERIAFDHLEVHGTIYQNGEETLSYPAERNVMEYLKVAKEFALNWLGLAYCAGVVFWHGRRKTPAIKDAGTSWALIWNVGIRKSLVRCQVEGNRPVDVNVLTDENDWQNKAGLLFYSYHKMVEPIFSDDARKKLQSEDKWYDAHPYEDWPENVSEITGRSEMSVSARSEETVSAKSQQSESAWSEEARSIQTGASTPTTPSARYDTPTGSDSDNSYGSTQSQGGFPMPIPRQPPILTPSTSRTSMSSAQSYPQVSNSPVPSVASSSGDSLTPTPIGVRITPARPVDPVITEPTGTAALDTLAQTTSTLTRIGLEETFGTIGSAVGASVGSAVAGSGGELVGGMIGAQIGTQLGSTLAGDNTAAEPPAQPQAENIDGQWYLPGLPNPVTAAEANDPGNLEINVDSIECTTFMTSGGSSGSKDDGRSRWSFTLGKDGKTQTSTLAFMNTRVDPKVRVEVRSPDQEDSLNNLIFEKDEDTSTNEELLERLAGVYWMCGRTHEIYKVEKIGSELTKEEERTHVDMVNRAKKKELQQWVQHDSFVIRRKSLNIACGKPMTARWVLTWKLINNKKEVKARLCIKGFQDPQLGDLITASATASSLSHKILCSAAVNRGWVVASLDISTAFLQGKTFAQVSKEGQMQRSAFFNPPEDVYRLLHEMHPEKYPILLEVFSASEVMFEALKAIYGLGDAPRLWREAFHEEMLKKLGFHRSNYDECFYIRKIFPGAARTQLIATMHVDDIEVAGAMKDIMWLKAKLEERFGAIKGQFWDFKHTGVFYHQNKDLTQIVLEQKSFVEQMEYYAVSKEQKQQKDRKLNAVEHKAYRSILGGLLWLNRTRADLAAELSQLQRKAASPVIEDLVQANVLLRRAKDFMEAAVLTYKKQPDGPKRLVVDPDSSFNAKDDPKSRSQAGWVVVLVPDNGESLDCDCAHALSWHSKRVNRVTKNTLAAEGIAHATAIEEAVKIAGWLHEIDNPIGSVMSMIETAEGGFSIPIDVTTDARSLYDVITSPVDPKPQDTSSLLWFRWIREVYGAKITRRMIWKCTTDMLGDALTKKGVDTTPLLNLLSKGIYKTEYACLCGGGIIDAWKGLPPSKKEKEQQEPPYEKWLEAFLIESYHLSKDDVQDWRRYRETRKVDSETEQVLLCF